MRMRKDQRESGHAFRTNSNQTPSTSGTSAWPPNIPWEPTWRVTRVTSAARARRICAQREGGKVRRGEERREKVDDAPNDHAVDGVFEIEDFATGNVLDQGRLWAQLIDGQQEDEMPHKCILIVCHCSSLLSKILQSPCRGYHKSRVVCRSHFRTQVARCSAALNND